MKRRDLVLESTDLHYAYRLESGVVKAVDGVSFTLARGEMLAIQGPSGSGKSTLLYLLGLMLAPQSGSLRIGGTEARLLEDMDRSRFRNRRIGFIFQQFHLLPRATIRENLLLPARIAGSTGEELTQLEARVLEIARRLGLEEQLEKRPNQLSGGQQQRVAIGRALLFSPELLLADEPTGNLDSKTAAEILALLRELASEGHGILIITHDHEVAARCDRVLHYRDGRIEREVRNALGPAAGTEPPRRGDGARSSGDGARPRGGRSPFQWARLALELTPALENLRRNRVRSALTMLGVTLGIASVLAMVTLGSFVRDRILESFQSLGANKVMIYAWQNSELKAKDRFGMVFREFDFDHDLLPMRRAFPEVRLLSPVYQSWNDTAVFGGREMTGVRTVGVSPEYLEITNRSLSAGAPLNPHHVESSARVCLIGSEVNRELFQGRPALGQIIQLTLSGSVKTTCRVIGLLTPQPSNESWNQPDQQILVTHTFYKSVTGLSPQTRRGGMRGGMSIAMQIHPEFDADQVGQNIRGWFETKYGQSARFMNGFDANLVSQMKRFLGLFAILLAGIAVVSLVVGAVGIANMMLVSVSERVREIGLRRALGATARSIRRQFLLESSLLCWIAGGLGLTIGFVSYEVLIYFASLVVDRLKFEWVMLPGAWLVSFLTIVGTGLAAGIVPALRAEKIEVIEALRAE